MNLAEGKILDKKVRQEVLEGLEERITHTLSKGNIKPSTVIEACDKLSKTLNENEHLPLLRELGFCESLARDYLEEVKQMLSRDYLMNKLKQELGEDLTLTKEYKPLYRNEIVHERIIPLGVLLHIAAGNAEGLPVFSVVEGLLAGNINILKLPEMDGDISVKLLQELIRIEPALTEYVYVFDYSSKDTDAIGKLVEIADAVVVWGGDEAVGAVRKIAKPNTKVIEWGHKISFAYVTEQGMKDDAALIGLARNICSTNQLLCSSCQGIFVDTDSMETVYKFSQRFIDIMDGISMEYPSVTGIGIQAQVTLSLYNEALESLYNEKRIYRKGACSITAYNNQTLEPGIMFRNCWAKPLPRRDLLAILRPYKNHLQTVGLLCEDTERRELSEIFYKTGIVRITNGENMSKMYCGSAHDGEYPLRRYTKIVSEE